MTCVIVVNLWKQLHQDWNFKIKKYNQSDVVQEKRFKKSAELSIVNMDKILYLNKPRICMVLWQCVQEYF